MCKEGNRGEEREHTVPGDKKRDGCDLCGLPLGPSSTSATEGGGVHRFCCPGCRYVYQILSASAGGDLPLDFRETDIYRACVESGVIPGDAPLPASGDISFTEPPEGALELSFRAEGMWCPACGWLIEEVLRKTPGVAEARVSFFADTVRLAYMPYLISPAEIYSRIRRLGYPVSSPEEDGDRTGKKGISLTRLVLSAILTMNGMMLSMALYFGFVRDLSSKVIAYFSYPLLLLAAPVVFWGGFPILRKGWASLRVGAPSMDTLIAVSALAAFFYSVAQMVRGSIHLYFDTAAMLVTIVLLGRYIETHARDRILATLGAGFGEAGGGKVRLIEEGTEKWVKAVLAKPGDRFLVRPGERVGLDGIITVGTGLLDQSVLTGEAAPVSLAAGDPVPAGSLLIEGGIEVTASRSYEEGSMAGIARLTTQALERKDREEERIDSLGRIFVPAVMAIAAGTGITMAFMGFKGDEILLRTLTVLLISCPCALGIATPLAKIAVIGLARKKGILVKNPEALGQVTALDTMVLDKTGTVTEGAFTFREVVPHGADEREVFSRLAALEHHSTHFLAREIVRKSRNLHIPDREAGEVVELKGLGVTGILDGTTAFAGSRLLLAHLGVALAAALEEEARKREEAAMTVVFFGWEGQVRGFLAFGDRLKQGAQELVRRLITRRIRVLLVSGDGGKTTGAVARLLGITDFSGGKTPQEKAAIIAQLQEEGHTVAMAGDGVNDAAALAGADVGIAMGMAGDIMKEASDLVIPGGNPFALTDIFHLSALFVRTTRRNLFLAFFYNSVAIPIAVIGFLNPLMAVTAMFMSSLMVIGNALMVARGRWGE